MNKRRKILLAALAIVVVAVALVGASLFWSMEPPIAPIANIDYWFREKSFQRTGDQSLNVSCKNIGSLDGTFNLTVTFENASFSNSTPQPYEQLSRRAVKFTLTLHAGEATNTTVHFTIDNDTNRFTVSLSTASQQNSLRFAPMPVNSLGQQYTLRQAEWFWVEEVNLFGTNVTN